MVLDQCPNCSSVLRDFLCGQDSILAPLLLSVKLVGETEYFHYMIDTCLYIAISFSPNSVRDGLSHFLAETEPRLLLAIQAQPQELVEGVISLLA